MTHEEALDIFKCLAWHDLRPSEEKIEMAFKVLSDKPSGKWIPVSERLPEEHKEVLTCSLGGFIEIQSIELSYCNYWENQKGDWSDIDEIIAWMPLPESYKGD